MVCWTCFCDLSSVADSIWMKWFMTSSSSSDSFLQVLINETTDQQLLRLSVLHVHDLLLLLMHCTSMHLQKWYHLVLFVARIFILDCVGVSLQFFWLMILHVLILVRLTSLQNLVSTLPVFHMFACSSNSYHHWVNCTIAKRLYRVRISCVLPSIVVTLGPRVHILLT